MVATHSARGATPCESLHFPPLVWSQYFTNPEEHTGVGFFKVRPRLCNGVNLAEDFCLIELVGLKKGTQHNFIFLKGRVQVDQLEAVLLKDVAHLLFLVVGEADLLGDLRIVPPASALATAEEVLHRSAARSAALRALPILGERRYRY